MAEEKALLSSVLVLLHDVGAVAHCSALCGAPRKSIL